MQSQIKDNPMDIDGDQLESHYRSDMLKGVTADHLNTLLPATRGWRKVLARTHHEDLFGQVVAPGQHYFERLGGMGFGDKLKLSSASMDRVLAAVFFESGELRNLADVNVARAKEREMDEMRRASELLDAHNRKLRAD